MNPLLYGTVLLLADFLEIQAKGVKTVKSTKITHPGRAAQILRCQLAFPPSILLSYCHSEPILQAAAWPADDCLLVPSCVWLPNHNIHSESKKGRCYTLVHIFAKY